MSSKKGSFAYENWHCLINGAEVRSSLEFPLYTDAHIIGRDLKFGPYELINTVPISTKTEICLPAVILRMDYYVDFDHGNLQKTNTDRFHGGSINDEIASLLSLCLGVRFKSGGMTRLFEKNKSPKGRPVFWEMEQNPVLLKNFRNLILPNVLEGDLAKAEIIKTFEKLSAKASIELIRSSKLYQDALWLSETSPELSWIMLVSAVETAANYWRSSNETPRERLKTFDESLETILLESGGEELTEKVAQKIADFMGSTKKFVDFIIEFLPNAPDKRPSEIFQHSWDPENMKKSLKKIYKWRSWALHRGIPFPTPMCNAPHNYEGGLEEIPMLYGYGAKGGTWIKEDSPMLLHTFEYIVRGCLLNWWKSLVN